MLLESLRNLNYKGFEPAGRMYGSAKVRYLVDLSGAGQLLNWIDTYDAQTKKVSTHIVPQLDSKSVNIVALPFFGNAEYTFGLPRPVTTLERVPKCQAVYLALVQECSAATNDLAVQTVLTFLENDPVSQLAALKGEEFTAFDRTAFISFMVDGQFVVDRPAVQSFWADKNDKKAGQGRVLECIVCGNTGPVLETLEHKVKGLPGAVGAGVPLISANSKVFESYGLEGSYIAPVCATCSERFTKALNFLLEREDTHFKLDNLRFAFWTRGREVSQDITDLQPPKRKALKGRREGAEAVASAQVKALLESPKHTSGAVQVDDSRFYAVTLAANPGRAIVRDWIDTSLPAAEANARDWFARQQIIARREWLNRQPKDAAPRGPIIRLTVRELATATVRSKAKGDARNPAPGISYALLRSAIMGERLPSGLLHQVVRRCQAERTVTTERAALVKLVLLSEADKQLTVYLNKEGFMEQLEQDFRVEGNDRATAAYHCGRVLAVLERIQEVAIDRSTLSDRFFGAALTTPGLTLPSLVRLAQQAHLPAIKKDSKGLHDIMRRSLTAALNAVPKEAGIPAVLKLKEQGWFILGYHHQLAASDLSRSENRAKQQQREATQQPMPFDEQATDGDDNN